MAAAAGGVALASPANAAKLGDVDASAAGAPPQEWTSEALFNTTKTVTESEAWRQCDASFGAGKTKAVVLTAYDYTEEGDNYRYTGHWECHDSAG